VALEGKIKVPGLGEVGKKPAVIGVGIGVAIVVVVIVRKKATANNTAPGTTQAASGDQTDPAGNVGQIDPATGYVTGSPEDQQALAQGSTAAFSDLGLGGIGVNSGIDPATGIPYAYETGGGSSGGTTTTTAVTPTRETWLEQAISDMSAPNLAEIAPKIWAGIAVSKADKDTFLEAVALEGAPPGGYPTPIKLTDTAGQPGPTGTVTVPHVVGEHLDAAEHKLEAAGFKPVRNTVPKGKSVIVTSQSPAGGTKAKKGSSVALIFKVA